MRGDEARIVDAFCSWLEGQGWAIRREVEFVDVLAEKDGQRIYAEAKGRTTAPGLDIDTLYGQLLRRMPPEEVGTARFARRGALSIGSHGGEGPVESARAAQDLDLCGRRAWKRRTPRLGRVMDPMPRIALTEVEEDANQMKVPLDSADGIRVVRQHPRLPGSEVLLRLVDKIPFAFVKHRAYRILLVPEKPPDG